VADQKRLPNKNRLLLVIRYWCIVFLYAQTNSDIIGFMSQLMIQQSKQLLYCAQVIDRPALLSGDLEPTYYLQRTGIDS
jgi:hypothetical protein